MCFFVVFLAASLVTVALSGCCNYYAQSHTVGLFPTDICMSTYGSEIYRCLSPTTVLYQYFYESNDCSGDPTTNTTYSTTDPSQSQSLFFDCSLQTCDPVSDLMYVAELSNTGRFTDTVAGCAQNGIISSQKYLLKDCCSDFFFTASQKLTCDVDGYTIAYYPESNTDCSSVNVTATRTQSDGCYAEDAVPDPQTTASQYYYYSSCDGNSAGLPIPPSLDTTDCCNFYTYGSEARPTDLCEHGSMYSSKTSCVGDTLVEQSFSNGDCSGDPSNTYTHAGGGSAGGQQEVQWHCGGSTCTTDEVMYMETFAATPVITEDDLGVSEISGCEPDLTAVSYTAAYVRDCCVPQTAAFASSGSVSTTCDAYPPMTQQYSDSGCASLMPDSSTAYTARGCTTAGTQYTRFRCGTTYLTTAPPPTEGTTTDEPMEDITTDEAMAMASTSNTDEAAEDSTSVIDDTATDPCSAVNRNHCALYFIWKYFATKNSNPNRNTNNGNFADAVINSGNCVFCCTVDDRDYCATNITFVNENVYDFAAECGQCICESFFSGDASATCPATDPQASGAYSVHARITNAYSFTAVVCLMALLFALHF